MIMGQQTHISEVLSDNGDMRRDFDKVFDYLQAINMNMEDVNSRMV
jgi:hypothetical protein